MTPRKKLTKLMTDKCVDCPSCLVSFDYVTQHCDKCDARINRNKVDKEQKEMDGE